MSLTRASAAVIKTEEIVGTRNLIINGDMQIAQRGTSATVSDGSNEGYSTIDRWYINMNNAISGAVIFSQSSDAPSGFPTSAKVQCSTTNTSLTTNNYVALLQRIEAQTLQQLAYGTSDTKDMVLSWYMKTETYAGPISVNFYTSDGTVEYFTVSVTPTTSWAKYSIRIPGSTSATINNDNGLGMTVQFVLCGDTGSSIAAESDSTGWSTTRADYRNNVGNILSNTSNAFYLTGVQLEVGSVATPFERRPYGTELALCERYYYKIKSELGSGSGFATGYVNSATVLRATFNFPVTMRTAPTAMETSGTASDYSIGTGGSSVTTCSSVPQYGSYATKNTAKISAFVASGLTTGQAGQLQSASDNAFLAWSAEL